MVFLCLTKEHCSIVKYKKAMGEIEKQVQIHGTSNTKPRITRKFWLIGNQD